MLLRQFSAALSVEITGLQQQSRAERYPRGETKIIRKQDFAAKKNLGKRAAESPHRIRSEQSYMNDAHPARIVCRAQKERKGKKESDIGFLVELELLGRKISVHAYIYPSSHLRRHACVSKSEASTSLTYRARARRP